MNMNISVNDPSTLSFFFYQGLLRKVDTFSVDRIWQGLQKELKSL